MLLLVTKVRRDHPAKRRQRTMSKDEIRVTKVVRGEVIATDCSACNWCPFPFFPANRFQRVMEAMGVDDALQKAGAKVGDLIMIDKWDFDFK